MSHPHSIALAHLISPQLSGISWAIGGSTLLYRLGIESSPFDLDLVVREDDFENAVDRLTSVLGTSTRPAHPDYMSKHFARFHSTDGAGLDIMAGIAARTPTGIVSWSFSPSRIVFWEGLPWMPPEDWLELYALFGRTKRVEQLKAFLSVP